jgi:hypothetical protein
MSTYSIKDIAASVDRHKIFVLACKPEEQSSCVSLMLSNHIPTVNVGKELATYIDCLQDYRYLTIDTYDFTKKLLDSNKAKITPTGNEIIAIYNLGILLEPILEINPAALIKEFSKSAAILIIHENEIEQTNILNWNLQKNDYSLNFSDTPLKKIQYEI